MRAQMEEITKSMNVLSFYVLFKANLQVPVFIVVGKVEYYKCENVIN